MREKWGSVIDFYDLILSESQHIADLICKQYRPDAAKNKDAIFEVITRLQARACLIASEVRALFVSGHANGAMARWRSIQEVLVVTLFIAEHDASLAKHYLLYDTVQTLKNIEEYNKSCSELNLPSYDDTDEIERLQAEQERLISEYGKAFIKANGWAAAALGGEGRVTINKIEEAVNLQKMRIFYSIASNPIHANVKAFSDALVIGPSSKGFAGPVQYTLVALVECTVRMLQLRPSVESQVLEINLEQLLTKASVELTSINQEEQN